MELGEFRRQIPDVPIMVLTATAVPRVQKSIQTALGLRGERKGGLMYHNESQTEMPTD